MVGKRIFFLVLAFALLAQGALLLGSRAGAALDALEKDFKIVVVLPGASARQARDFAATLAALPGVTKAEAVNPAAVYGEQEGPVLQALDAELLPSFFSLGVSREVLLAPAAWAQANINALGGDVSPYFSAQQARLAVYISALKRGGNILFALCAFAVVSFGFFVEARYAPQTPLKSRLGGVLAALIAFALAAGIAFVVAAPLNKIYPEQLYNMLHWHQAALLVLCLLAGWTLSKWQKF